MHLTWLEISSSALRHNLSIFRQLIGKGRILAPAIKGNAYGHGLVECGKIFEQAGADFLCVNALYEAEKLRKAGVKSPLLIMGYTPLSDLADALNLKCEMVAYNPETIEALKEVNKKARIHLKIETGNHRQGVLLKDMEKILEKIRSAPNIQLVGLSTHFANIEDRLQHDYALYQLKQFKKAVELTKKAGFNPEYLHSANSAATLVLPESHFNFVRPGIGMYGLWPSDKTERSAQKIKLGVKLKPALTWKARIAQVKEVEKGALIGYGCTYKMPQKGWIAILPVGYYDGFVRLLGNKGQILIAGKRCPVVGRIFMNMIAVNVSHAGNIKPENEAVLLGGQGDECITAEEIADLSGTINYEVTTRIGEHVPRVVVE